MIRCVFGAVAHAHHSGPVAWRDVTVSARKPEYTAAVDTLIEAGFIEFEHKPVMGFAVLVLTKGGEAWFNMHPVRQAFL